MHWYSLLQQTLYTSRSSWQPPRPAHSPVLRQDVPHGYPDRPPQIWTLVLLSLRRCLRTTGDAPRPHQSPCPTVLTPLTRWQLGSFQNKGPEGILVSQTIKLTPKSTLNSVFDVFPATNPIQLIHLRDHPRVCVTKTRQRGPPQVRLPVAFEFLLSVN